PALEEQCPVVELDFEQGVLVETLAGEEPVADLLRARAERVAAIADGLDPGRIDDAAVRSPDTVDGRRGHARVASGDAPGSAGGRAVGASGLGRAVAAFHQTRA